MIVYMSSEESYGPIIWDDGEGNDVFAVTVEIPTELVARWRAARDAFRAVDREVTSIYRARQES